MICSECKECKKFKTNDCPGSADCSFLSADVLKKQKEEIDVGGCT